MKNGVFTLMIVLICLSGFAQNSTFEYTGRFNPSVKKDKLIGVNKLSDITPELWTKLMLSYYDKEELNHKRKTDFTQGFSIQPQEYNYNNIVDYISVEISALRNGKMVAAKNSGEQLTSEQKEILTSAELGSDINIKIDFKFKNQTNFKAEGFNNVRTGTLVLSVIPEVEAEYPGGFNQLTEYYITSLFNKMPEKESAQKIRQATVKFTVDETGHIMNSEITRTSSDPKTDRLILEATNKMPDWKPAKNAGGIKVKQEFNIPFGGPGC